MFVINAKGNIISVQETEPITSGSVNVYQCRFAFDDSWEGFFRSAVFRVGAMVRTVPLNDEDSCELPWELLAKKNIGLPVEVSVYGSKDETEILPTIWDKMGRVRSGSVPGEDAKEPTPTVYDQLTNLVRIYSDRVTEYRNVAEESAQAASLSAQAAADAATASTNAAASAVQSESNALASAESASASAAEAEEWSKKAEQAAGGGVLSFKGRNGEVTPQSGDYTAEMVGADASGAAASALTSAKAYTDSKVPTKVSQLTNDKGYITGYTETDPTVPAWAKAASKPSYTASEVGAAPSGFGLGCDSTIITNQNLIDAVKGKSGFYKGTNVTNAPDSGWWWYLVLGGGGTTTAIAFKDGSPDMYTARIGHSATSVSWKAISLNGHNHDAGNITSGTLPVARGGTGATTAAAARTNLGAAPTIKYGTSDVAAGAASGFAEGTLYVVLE